MIVLKGDRVVVKFGCDDVWLLVRVGGKCFIGIQGSGGGVVGLYVFEEFGA